MKIELKELKRINLKDGDIIFFPIPKEMESRVFNNHLNGLVDILTCRFPKKRFLLVSGDSVTIKGIKVINIYEK